MITLYCGTPGSGKSLMVAKEILFEIRVKKRNVIVCNMSVNPDYVCRKGKNDAKLLFAPTYAQIQNPYYLFEYAKKYHKKGIEGQTLVVFDEIQELLSPTVCKRMRTENPDYVKDWLTFFSQHRHLGYDVYFVTQYDRMLVHDIRYLVEYKHIHRKLRNNGDMGFLIAFFLRLIFGIELFIQISTWCATREKMGHRFYWYSKKLSKVYDSYKKFADMQTQDSVACKPATVGSANFIEQMENFNKIVEFPENKKTS